jgi:hypothetical protein
MTTHVLLNPVVVERLEPFEETENRSSWISPFAVPHSAEVETIEPGRIRFIRFLYSGGEVAGKNERSVPLDQRTDPEVEIIFSTSIRKVIALRFKSSADASALGRVGDRLVARGNGEEHTGERFSLLMIGRVLKECADSFAGAMDGDRQPLEPPPRADKEAKMPANDQLETPPISPVSPAPRSNASRSTKVRLINYTDKTLQNPKFEAEWGVFTKEPPSVIEPHNTAEWETESKGVMTGTEGWVEFELSDGSGKLRLWWNNPYVGGNRYKPEDPKGYQTCFQGGRGDNAEVIFEFRSLPQKPEGLVNSIH